MLQSQPRHINFKLPPSMLRPMLPTVAVMKKDLDQEVRYHELLNMAALFK
ncbi:MAG: hypothetical protein JWO78_1509 [Micavibrio sp.]|nr:hypothetical protein [Micavibrio sp.]